MNKPKLFFIAALFSAAAIHAQSEKKADSLTTERPFQLTFIPPLGTNGIDAYKITNKISINIFAGVSRGVNGFEGGGFVNVLLKDMNGLQLSGFTNVVLGNVTGIQGAGFVNCSGGNFKGAAFAGFCNLNKGPLYGGQFAGFVNANADSLKGVQGAGFCNATSGSLKGIQGAGFANFAGAVTGLQGAGFCNVAHGAVEGAQLAGFANVATGDLNGIQASGFFNRARKVKGLQIGMFNIADSVDGVSLGFLNIVRHGLHQVELSADELFYANLSVRTGTHRFYNIFSIGAAPKSGNFNWQIGYGIGTSLKLTEKWRPEMALSAHHISSGLFFNGASELYKLYIGVEYKLANKCYIAGGPTFNLYMSDTYLPDYKGIYSGIAPYALLNETNTYGFNFKAWAGFKVAIRFL